MGTRLGFGYTFEITYGAEIKRISNFATKGELASPTSDGEALTW